MAERNQRPEDVAEIAVRDLEGIRAADVVVLLAGVPEGRAKYAEMGAAIALAVEHGRPRIYVVGDSPEQSIFFFHPSVRRVGIIEDVVQDVESQGL